MAQLKPLGEEARVERKRREVGREREERKEKENLRMNELWETIKVYQPRLPFREFPPL